MRTITHALLAIGFVGAMDVSTPISAKAQGIYFSGAGVGIELTTRPYNHRHARYDRYYDNQPYSHQYYRGPNGRYGSYQRCPPNYTVQNGVCYPYRGY